MRRPSVHFAPDANWMNDPNGMFHLDGVWHLIYQHNPHGPEWGNMSWGHAVSTDLLHWSERDVALPFGEDFGVFSGSAVVDHDNTSGLGSEAEGAPPPVVAFYTKAVEGGTQSQWMAVSRDAGETWSYVGDEPVADRGSANFRDPKVFRYARADGVGEWRMVAVEAEDRQIVVYRSADLLTWEFAGSFGPVGPRGLIWECPDLFPLPVDGDAAGAMEKWVLLLSLNPTQDDATDEARAEGSHMVYLVGSFDGSTFVPDDPERWDRVDLGPDFYAGVTFDNAPDRRRIMIGWVSNWLYAHEFPHTGWRGTMSLPRELSLATVDGRVRLVQRPLLAAGSDVELDAEVVPGDGLSIVADGAGDLLTITPDVDTGSEVVRVDRHEPVLVGDWFRRAVAVPAGGDASLRVILDGDVVEVFADQGLATFTAVLAPTDGQERAVVEGGAM